MEETTQSICPECLKRIDAKRIRRGDDIYLEKRCPAHGTFTALLWRGTPDFDGWRRPKIPKSPAVTFGEVKDGCPFDCGICPNHNQRSCTILLEITDRCNLRCPVCYADSGCDSRPDPPLDVIRVWFERARRAGGDCNIQLSGGEPTVRDDLPEIVALGRETGFSFIQVNTNGVRAARDRGFVGALKAAGLSSVFLQFDGVSDGVYKTLRGRPLLEEKMAAITAFGEAGVGVVLVPTVVPGVNDGEIGDILRLAVERSPVVRAVHFQPVSYFGRCVPLAEAGSPDGASDHTPDHVNDPKARITLPDLMRAVESQTGGRFKVADFRPPGCENARCSFHGNFMVMPGGKVVSLQKENCRGTPIPAEEGADKAIAYVARQWSGRGAPPRDRMIFNGSNDCCPKPEASDGPLSLDVFIERARTHTLSVSAMAFQDAWSVDLERTRDCCIHVMSPDGRLVPFCLYNITASNGQSLHRNGPPDPV